MHLSIAKTVKVINQIQWKKIGKWQFNALSWLVLMEGQEDYRFKEKGLPFGFSKMLAVNEDQYIAKKDLAGWVQYIGRLVNKTRFLVHIKKLVLQSAAQLNFYTESIRYLNPRSLSSMQIIEKISQFEGDVKNLFVTGYLYIPFDEAIEKYLIKELSRLDKDPGDLLPKLIIPRGTSYVAREEKELLRLAAKIYKRRELKKIFRGSPKSVAARLSRQVPELFNQIDRHRDEYAWIMIFNWIGEPYGIAYYISRIQKYLRGKENPVTLLRNRISEERRNEKNYEQLTKAFPQQLRKTIELVRDHLELKLYRWDVGCIAAYRSRPLLAEAARRMGVALDDVWYLTFREIKENLKKEAKSSKLKKLIRRRRKNQVIVKLGRFVLLWEGKEAFLIRSQLKLEAENKKIETLQGFPAFKGGVIRGRVRIMHTAREIDQMEQDEILVCPMTDPDYMPAIYKARALITDQGGILCHAAIVARELKKPCIIGTEAGTRFLKTGNSIEMNSDTGEIKIGF